MTYLQNIADEGSDLSQSATECINSINQSVQFFNESSSSTEFTASQILIQITEEMRVSHLFF